MVVSYMNIIFYFTYAPIYILDYLNTNPNNCGLLLCQNKCSCLSKSIKKEKLQTSMYPKQAVEMIWKID
jgi:hypothetical protein